MPPEITLKHTKRGKKNVIYIAAEHLFDHSKDFQGCGYFPKLRDKQLLTSTGFAKAQTKQPWRPSRWKLPPGFSRERCRPHSPLADKKRKGEQEGASRRNILGRYPWTVAGGCF